MTSLMQSAVIPQRRAALALFELTVNDGELTATSTATDERFDVAEYSRFKYGFYPQAERYGSLLAQGLEAHFDEFLAADASQPIVVIGTPYKSMPNAAKLLASVAARDLHDHGFDASSSRIYQHRLAEGDYGTLSAAMREQRNRQKKYHFDAIDFAGKHVVVVDDVRITGSIERSVVALLSDVDWLSLTVMNLVRLDPEVALSNPKIEDTLNHASIRTLDDLLLLMERRDQFILITRTVKRILEADLSDLKKFLLRLDAVRRIELYHAAVDDGYDQMERYADSFKLLGELYPY